MSRHHTTTLYTDDTLFRVARRGMQPLPDEEQRSNPAAASKALASQDPQRHIREHSRLFAFRNIDDEDWVCGRGED